MAAERRTIQVGLTAPAQTQSYELAPGLAQFVQSVYIEVDTSGSGDVSPTLTISEQSGVVIAKTQQGSVIDGGGSGSATWALRLAANGSATATGAIRFDFDNQGGSLDVTTNDVSPFNPLGGGLFMQDLSGGGMYLQARNVAMTKLARISLDTGQRILVVSTESVFVRGANAGPSTTWDSGSVTFDTATSTVVAIKGVGGATVFQVANDSTSVSNLKTGKTFIWNDNGGNPILTLTG